MLTNWVSFDNLSTIKWVFFFFYLYVSCCWCFCRKNDHWSIFPHWSLPFCFFKIVKICCLDLFCWRQKNVRFSCDAQRKLLRTCIILQLYVLSSSNDLHVVGSFQLACDFTVRNNGNCPVIWFAVTSGIHYIG